MTIQNEKRRVVIEAMDVAAVAGFISMTAGSFVLWGLGWSLIIAGGILCAFALLCLLARITMRGRINGRA